MPTEQNNYDTITMVDRALQIFHELYLSPEPVGVTELAKNLDLPKATVYRILNTLLKSNFVSKDLVSEKYELGLSFIQYSEKVKSKLDLKTVAESSMNQLANETGESVNLGVLLDETVLTLFNVDGESSVLVSKLLPVSPLHCSSMGKILMCSKDEAFIRSYFESKHFQPRTIHTLTTYEAFMSGRDQILNEGIAYDAEEYEYGLTCIAAPVTNHLGEVIAALSVSGPTTRLQYKGMDRIIQSLRTSAGDISRRVVQAGLE